MTVSGIKCPKETTIPTWKVSSENVNGQLWTFKFSLTVNFCTGFALVFSDVTTSRLLIRLPVLLNENFCYTINYAEVHLLFMKQFL